MLLAQKHAEKAMPLLALYISYMGGNKLWCGGFLRTLADVPVELSKHVI